MKRRKRHPRVSFTLAPFIAAAIKNRAKRLGLSREDLVSCAVMQVSDDELKAWPL